MAEKWNLVADIGGTNARFSALLDDGSLESEFEFHHSVEEYPQFADLIGGLLEEIATATGWSSKPTNVCFAVACPADNEEITFTNSHWQFTKTQLKQLLGCETLSVINDFEAVAHGITELDDSDLVKVGGGDAIQTKPIGILGAGTGLGVAGLYSTQRVIMLLILRAVMLITHQLMMFRARWLIVCVIVMAAYL